MTMLECRALATTMQRMTKLRTTATRMTKPVRPIRVAIAPLAIQLA